MQWRTKAIVSQSQYHTSSNTRWACSTPVSSAVMVGQDDSWKNRRKIASSPPYERSAHSIGYWLIVARLLLSQDERTREKKQNGKTRRRKWRKHRSFHAEPSPRRKYLGSILEGHPVQHVHQKSRKTKPEKYQRPDSRNDQPLMHGFGGKGLTRQTEPHGGTETNILRPNREAKSRHLE